MLPERAKQVEPTYGRLEFNACFASKDSGSLVFQSVTASEMNPIALHIIMVAGFTQRDEIT